MVPEREQCVRTIEYFILSHELAHVGLGHLNNGSRFPERLLFLQKIADKFCPTTSPYRHEVEADIVASFLTYEHIGRMMDAKSMPETIALASLSAISFLFVVLEFATSLYEVPHIASGLAAIGEACHPPLPWRRALTESLFYRLIETQGSKSSADALIARNLQDAAILKEAFNLFLEKCDSEISFRMTIQTILSGPY